jgi:hypothetical protein
MKADKKIDEQVSGKTLDNQPVQENLLTLKKELKTESIQADINENLFGKFFCDRAEFYIITNPQNEIYSARPESITLYYLDGELSQTKYILTEDITTHLIKMFGDFKITGFDLKNKTIIASEQVFIKTQDDWTLNDNLDNYELKWTIGDKQIKYSVRLNRQRERFVYFEKLKDYENTYSQIEKNCI